MCAISPALELLFRAATDHLSDFSAYNFRRCRNHLLVLLSVANAQRTGVLMKFKVADHNNGLAQVWSSDDNLVFVIADHKTNGTHGAATQGVSNAEAELLAGYMVMRQNMNMHVRREWRWSSTCIRPNSPWTLPKKNTLDYLDWLEWSSTVSSKNKKRKLKIFRQYWIVSNVSLWSWKILSWVAKT